ncbi:MAG: exodeoxyribonuclease VII small subunit [Ruminococcus sp.]|nr:exodeoxyribonuclease VII small subunit [Ruminococcus sp.]MBQ7133391.1 exodeoxyribonuclease VII small subunit [Ruminococcus sp.]
MNKELSFEQANKQLEEIVAKMEKPDVPLEDMMKLYEEAYKLLIYCTKKLEETRGQIVDINERIENMKSKGDSLFED